MSRSYSPKIRYVCDRAHRESPVDETIMDEHVGDPKHRDSKTSAETEAGDEAFVEEAIGEEGYSWNSVNYGENIVKFKWSFSWFMVGLVHMPRSRASNGLEPWLKLNEKVVMVTGASSGLGREFCLDLAKAGCRIIAAARRVDRLRTLCDEINNRLGSIESNVPGENRARAVPVELDVGASGPIIGAAVEKAWDAFGRIDVLINNAGVRGSVHTPLNLAEEEWDSVINTNLRGVWLVSKYVCMRMCSAQQGGSVINISSTAGLNRGHLPGCLIYASSKAAVNTMTKVMAMELGPYKIRVNCISPGIFKSEITETLLQKDWLKTVAFKTVPLQTHGTSDPALTSLVRYLIHDSSEYVTGNIFIVEAGATLPGIPIFSSL